MHSFRPLVSGMLASLLVFPISVSVVFAAEFRAAAAKADITPGAGVTMWGYSDRTGPSTGTRDPLYAKVLVLDDGTTRLCWVTLDLGRPFGNESMNVVREKVRKSAGVTHVCFSASHTHSGPAIDEFYDQGKQPAWESSALDRIAAAIEAAVKKLEPALIGTGSGSVLIGHNRRLVKPDGEVEMFWRNPNKLPTHPVDSHVGVIRVDNSSGKTLAVVVNHACHPVIFGPDNLQFSADYPGAMADVVETAFGKKCVCHFLQGAAGNINPYYDKSKLDEGAEALMRESGRKLGEEALRVAKLIKPATPKTPEIQVSLETRHFSSRYDLSRLIEQMKARNLRPEFIERYRVHVATPMDLVVTSVLINREIAIMGIPGEPFCEFGINFRDRVPAASAFFAGYCNGFHGYFPTIQAASEGGYGAAGFTARVEVGAGETMVNMAVIRLLTMQGLLKPEP